MLRSALGYDDMRASMTCLVPILAVAMLLAASPADAQEETVLEDQPESESSDQELEVDDDEILGSGDADEGSVAAEAQLVGEAGLFVDAIEKQIVGWVENVRLEGSDLLVRAKLDTGADTSSLDVRYTRLFKLNRQRMVRFEIENPETDERVTFERPVVRMVRIKQHGGGYLRRPVVLMRVCLGNNAHEVEMSLADRSNFAYSMLLGRSALKDVAIIDPAQTYLNPPDCEEEEIYD